MKKVKTKANEEHEKVAKQSKIINKIKKQLKKDQNRKVEVGKNKQENKKDKREREETSKPNSNDNDKAIELDEKTLARIEKKKSKKLAKKLKLKEKKELEKSQPVTSQSGMEEIKVKKEFIEDVGSGKENTQQNRKKKDKKKMFKQEAEEGREPFVRDPSATIFVGNLPVTTKRVQIMKLFAKFGVRSIRLRTASGQVIFKHKQRKKAGSLNAYVVLKDAEEAKKALELNGLEFKTHHLRITPADKQTNLDKDDAKRTLFVGNLKHSANEKKLHEIFSNCGEIDYIRCLGNGKNGCKGVAFVCFKSPEAIGLALELNETLLDERPIHVERYSVKKLGAKDARDKQAARTQKPKPMGAKKRIKDRQQKNGMPEKSFEKKKKSDFHGVKATGIKKQKNTKKPNSEMKGLAKKIAPKIKKEVDT